jgi:undecaprenyl-diphosphatase
MQQLFYSIIVGIVQGLAEFLPISSTVHLAIVTQLLGSDIGIHATNIVSLGTTIALVHYWYKDIIKIIKDRKSLQYILLSTLPIILLYAITKKLVDGTFRNIFFMGVFLIIGGLLLLYAEYLSSKQPKEKRDIILHKTKSLKLSDYIFVGAFQALAIFPGMSRSGSTISGSLIRGLDRATAIKTSFIISIPAFVLSSLYGIYELTKQNSAPSLLQAEGSNFSWIAILISTVTAYIVGKKSLEILIPYLTKFDSKYFAYYRIALGILLILITRLYN